MARKRYLGDPQLGGENPPPPSSVRLRHSLSYNRADNRQQAFPGDKQRKYIIVTVMKKFTRSTFYPLLQQESYIHFPQLEVVSRYREPQLQVGENYAYLFSLRRLQMLIFKHLCHLQQQ